MAEHPIQGMMGVTIDKIREMVAEQFLVDVNTVSA